MTEKRSIMTTIATASFSFFFLRHTSSTAQNLFCEWIAIDCLADQWKQNDDDDDDIVFSPSASSTPKMRSAATDVEREDPVSIQ